MADAVVGDDVYSDDPTVRMLEEHTAALLGKEDAVYMVTGTMTNQVAIRAHTEPGDAVLFDQNAGVPSGGWSAFRAQPGRIGRRTPEFLKFPEHQMHRILHAHIRIQLHVTGHGPAQAHGQAEAQLSSSGLLANGLHRALPQNAQLEFTHRSAQPQHQAVIDHPRIVDPLRIDQHSTNQPTEFDQMVPVSAIARQAGGLQAKDRTDLPFTYLGNEPLKTGTVYQTGGGAPQIFIDGFHVHKPQLASVARQIVLP